MKKWIIKSLAAKDWESNVLFIGTLGDCNQWLKDHNAVPGRGVSLLPL